MSNSTKSSPDFDAFVKSQQPIPNEIPVDWNRERDEWLARLDELYKAIESYLEKYIRTGEIKIEYQDIMLHEENIGPYSARRLILEVGRKKIALNPIGTLYFGTKGIVNVAGPAGSTRLMLVNKAASGPGLRVRILTGPKLTDPEVWATEAAEKKINWVWKIVTSPPTVNYIDLTPDSFFQAIMEVANG